MGEKFRYKLRQMWRSSRRYHVQRVESVSAPAGTGFVVIRRLFCRDAQNRDRGDRTITVDAASCDLARLLTKRNVTMRTILAVIVISISSISVSSAGFFKKKEIRTAFDAAGCNVCVQAHGCQVQFDACNGQCNGFYGQPGDQRLGPCVDNCSARFRDCTASAQRDCTSCK